MNKNLDLQNQEEIWGKMCALGKYLKENVKGKQGCFNQEETQTKVFEERGTEGKLERRETNLTARLQVKIIDNCDILT